MGLITKHSADKIIKLDSADALAILEHGCEITLHVTTPVGTTFRVSARLIGTYSDTTLLIEPPQLSVEELKTYFQEQFWVNGRTFSPQGEGAEVHFRAQIKYVVDRPLAYIALKPRNKMVVKQSRKEPRYQLNLQGEARSKTLKTQCEVQDLSIGGCRFVTEPQSQPFQIGETIEISLLATQEDYGQLAPLYGRICNLSNSQSDARYGLEFDQKGRASARLILTSLKASLSELIEE